MKKKHKIESGRLKNPEICVDKNGNDIIKKYNKVLLVLFSDKIIIPNITNVPKTIGTILRPSFVCDIESPIKLDKAINGG